MNNSPLFPDPEKLGRELFGAPKDDPFDKAFEAHEKLFNVTATTVKRGIGVILFLWAMGILASLTVLGVLGYVAYHFLSKVW